MMDVVLVKDKDGKQEEILTGLDYSSVQVDIEMNTTWQLTFTVYKLSDSLVAFNLLQNKSMVKWHGQWLYVDQLTNDTTDGVPTKQVVAMHPWFAVSRIRANITPWSNEDTTDDNGNTTAATPVTYTAEQLMHLAFDGNEYGYTWEIKGASDSVQLTSMDRQSALDILNTYIIGDMGWVVTADNFHIIIQSLDSFKTDTGKMVNYYSDSDNSNLQWDTTSFFNAVKMYGANNVYLGEYVDQDSVSSYGKWYGDDVTSDTATSASQLNADAAKSVNTGAVPSSTMTSTYRGNFDDYQIGNMVQLVVDPSDFNHEMMVYGISATPYTGDPETITWTTGNVNKSNVTSMLQIQGQFNTKLQTLSKETAKLQASGGTTNVNNNTTGTMWFNWTDEEMSNFDNS